MSSDGPNYNFSRSQAELAAAQPHSLTQWVMQHHFVDLWKPVMTAMKEVKSGGNVFENEMDAFEINVEAKYIYWIQFKSTQSVIFEHIFS